MAFVTTIKIPSAGPYETGVLINNAGGYAAGHSATMTVDDQYATGDARDLFYVNQEIWAQNNNKASKPIEFLGICTAVTATTVRMGAGSKFIVADNDPLYTIDAGALAYLKARNTGLSVSGAATCQMEAVSYTHLTLPTTPYV